MREDLELKTQESFEGATDDEFARELEADPAALVEYVDQLQMHQRLTVALGAEPIRLTDSVLRELRYKGDSERFAKGVVDRIKGRGGLRRRWLELFAAAFVLGALGFFLLCPHDPMPAADQAELLFVVGQIPLDAGDARVWERLVKTHRVSLKTAKQVWGESAAGRRLVLISSTVDEGVIKTLFRDVAVPVLTWEPRLFPDLGMIPGDVYHQDWGTAADQVRLRTPAGPVVATSKPAPYSWGKAREDATVLATLEADPSRAVIFRYDRGAAMPGLKAPARRLGFFLFDWTPMVLTDEGWALFDESVRWCKGD